jgi:hypothetical protein
MNIYAALFMKNRNIGLDFGSDISDCSTTIVEAVVSFGMGFTISFFGDMEQLDFFIVTALV